MRLTSDIVETATPAGGAGGRLGFEREKNNGGFSSKGSGSSV